MILKKDDLIIALVKFGDRIGWSAEYENKDYGMYVTVRTDDTTIKEHYELLLLNAIETIVAVKNGVKEITQLSDDEKKLLDDFKDLLNEKLTQK